MCGSQPYRDCSTTRYRLTLTSMISKYGTITRLMVSPLQKRQVIEGERRLYQAVDPA